MPLPYKQPPRAPNPTIGSTNLPGWATVRLDELLAVGVIASYALDNLNSVQLLDVATAYARSAASGEAFDAYGAINAALSRTYEQRRNGRERATA